MRLKNDLTTKEQIEEFRKQQKKEMKQRKAKFDEKVYFYINPAY